MSGSIKNTCPQAPLEIPKSLQKGSAPIVEPVAPVQTAKPVTPVSPSSGTVDLKA